MSTMINVGCGNKPTKGWKNFDNSWSVRLAEKNLLTHFLNKMGFLSKNQQDFISFAKKEKIFWANAAKRIPENDSSVDVVYSCHMIEHLERFKVKCFLKESCRVLKSGGIIRIVVPDLKILIDNYLKKRDADKFISDTFLTRESPKNFVEKLKYIIVGDRNHQWMYDGESLCKLLSMSGFKDPVILEGGVTSIKDSGMLDLQERSDESIFVEAFKP